MAASQPSSATSARSQYNQQAITTAAKLHKARLAQTNRAPANDLPPPMPPPKRGMEELFPSFNRTGLGIALEYAAMGNQSVSDALGREAAALGASFEHLGLTLGTVIHGVDLKSDTSERMIAFIRQTLLERKVVFLRDQHLSEDEQVAFGRCFGELDAFPFGKPGENPYILEIVHDENRPGTENGWHTDVTWMERPSLGSIAQCVEVPPIGGDTLFADSAAAYHGLPDVLKTGLIDIEGINDYRIFLGEGATNSLPAELVTEIKSTIPFGVSHPLLRTHPETGKTSLYIHGGFLRHESLYNTRTGEALGEGESRRLVRELLSQHGRPEYVCRFKWTPGAMAFWDNRAVQHYAASDYYPHRRVLRRVTVAGDKPYYSPPVN